MNILGLSTFADSSAAIVQSGKIICAVEEERLNRVKHYEGMPWLAIEECLAIAGMSLRDIDVIAIGWNPFLGWNTRIAETAKMVLRTPQVLRGKASRGSSYVKGCREIVGLRRRLAGRYPSDEVPQKVLFVEHHLAHAASAFLSSPFERAYVIVADGIGESATISFFVGEGRRLRQMGRVSFPHSLGHLYASVTGFLGFRMTHDEGKVMALAAFGEDNYRGLFSRLVRVDRAPRTIRVDTHLLDYHAARKGMFPPEWVRLTGMTPRRRDEPLARCHRDLACSLQSCLERTMLALLGVYFPDETLPLCAAGGVFLNSVLNGRIQRHRGNGYFVQPAAGDNGVSVGAALHACSRFDPACGREPLSNVYLGREFTDQEIAEALSAHSMRAEPAADVVREVADLIMSGRVVGWYRGRMEFGPRALGNRSILASPGHVRTKDFVNSKVKHREPFRPFAGSVILEEADDYFEGMRESPFMLKVYRFRPGCASLFPAIRHVDSTCRVQTVTREQNAALHRLLTEIRGRTGHALLLNTSLNVAGEPIVNTPHEAVELMRTTELDALAVGDYLVRKEHQSHRAR